MSNIGNLLYVAYGICGRSAGHARTARLPNVSYSEPRVRNRSLLAPLHLRSSRRISACASSLPANVSQVSQQINAVVDGHCGRGPHLRAAGRAAGERRRQPSRSSRCREENGTASVRLRRAHGQVGLAASSTTTARSTLTELLRRRAASMTWTSAMSRTRPCCTTSRSTPSPARSSPSSARPAQARRRSRT